MAVDTVAAALLAAALFIWWTGGGRVEILGLEISARSWLRPAILAGVVFALGQINRLGGPEGPPLRPNTIEHVATRLARVTMGALAAAALGVTFAAIVHACGGLDSHGYVAFSRLLAEGKVERPLPDLSWLPVEDAATIAAPLGFIPSLDGQAIVPEFPPGAPLVMAFARTIAGPEAVFLVGWLAGLALASAVFAVTRRRYDTFTAMFATVCVIAHPVLAAYSLQAMSDVPAALWTALAVWLMTATDRPQPILAGLAGSLAVLTRPPLLLAMLVLGAVFARRKPRDAVVFGALLLPGVVGLMLLQYQLYGSPFVSGHGGAGHLFTLSTLPHNLLTHAKWLLIVNTPIAIVLVWLGVRSDPAFGRLTLLVCAAVVLPYFFYGVPFDDWEMQRFLLPGLVLLAPLTAQGAAVALRRVRSLAAGHLLLAVASMLLVAASARWLDARDVFRLAQKESKFPLVGEWFAGRTDPNAVVLAALHSGSVEYYSGRMTLRWDVMPADRLGPVVAALRARGQRAYLVLDETYEAQAFNRRFTLPDRPLAPSGVEGVRLEPRDRIFTVQIFELLSP